MSIDPDIRRAMVKVLKGPRVVGAGFLVTRRFIVTCRHLLDGHLGPADTWGEIRLQGVADQRSLVARPHPRYRTEASHEDLVILEVDDELDGMEPVVLGSSRGSHDHRFTAYGFPATDPAGAWEPGIIGRVDQEGQPFERLRLHETDVREGYSGGPLLDEQTRRVIGVISARPDNQVPDRPLRAAEATPAERLRALVPALTLSADCPYRDLESFREGDARFWKGRDTVLADLIAILDTRPSYLTVSGPSGVGKSSLLAAGLVAELRSERRRRTWDVRMMRPGLDPRAALHHAVIGEPAAQPGVVAENLATWHARAENRRLVLVIDQFEDLLLRAGRDDDVALRAFLDDLASPRLGELPLTIVAALREGFEDRLGEVAPVLKGKLFRHRIAMPSTLSRSELLDVIERPAEAIGLRFEPASVSEALVQATQAQFPANANDAAAGVLATALPVLEVALTQLWQSAATDGAITLKALNALTADHGLLGILARWADDVYSRRLAGSADRAVADDILVELVQFGEPADGSRDKGRRVRMAALRQRLGARANLDHVLQTLIAGRLVVAARGEDATIELIHDALMLRWAHYIELRQDSRGFLVWHEWLQREAELWMRPGNDAVDNRGRLLRDKDLTVAQDMQLKYAGKVSQHATRFIARSAQAERAARQRIRRWQQVALAAFLAAAGMLGYLLHRSRVAEADARAQTERADGVARTQAAAAAVQMSRRDGHTAEALVAAVRLGAAWPGTSPRAADELLEALTDAIDAVSWSATLSVGTEYLIAAAVSPDDRLVVTRSIDRPAMILRTRLWDARTAAVLQVVDTRDVCRLASLLSLKPSADARLERCNREAALYELVLPPLTRAVAFSPADSTLWVGATDGAIRQWSDRGVLRTLGRPDGHEIIALAFDRTGHRLLSVDRGGSAQVWDPGTGEPVGPAMSLGEPGSDGVLAADGSRGLIAGMSRASLFAVGASGADGATRIELPAGPPRPGRADPAPAPEVVTVALSADAGLAAIARCDAHGKATLHIWNAGQRRFTQSFNHGVEACASLQFSDDGCTLVSYDETADTAVAHALCKPRGSSADSAAARKTKFEELRTIKQLQVDEDGARRVTLPDSSTFLRDLRELFRFLYIAGTQTFAPSRDGRILLVEHSDSVLERRVAAELGSPPFDTARLRWSPRAAVSPDGRWLALRTGRRVAVRDLRAGGAATELGPCDEQGRNSWAVDFAPDGSALTARCGVRLTLWRHATSWQDQGPLNPTDDLATGRDPWLSVDWVPGSERIVISGTNGASLWSVAERRRIRTFPASYTLTAHAFTPDGRLAVLEIEHGRFRQPTDAQLHVVRTADGETLCSAAVPGAGDVTSLEISGEISDQIPGQIPAQVPGSRRHVLGITTQGPAYLWRTDDCALVRDLQLPQAATARLAPDGGVGVVSDAAGQSRVWPAAQGQPGIDLPGSLSYRVLAIDPRAPHTLAVATDRGNQVLLVNPVTGSTTALPELPVAGDPRALFYAPTGELVFVRSSDLTAFDPLQASRRYTLDMSLDRDSLRWSHDGKLAAARDDAEHGAIRVWRWADGARVASLHPGCSYATPRFLPDDDGLVVDCFEGGAVYSFRRDELLRQGCDRLRGRPEYAEVRAICDPLPPLPTVALP